MKPDETQSGIAAWFRVAFCAAAISLAAILAAGCLRARINTTIDVRDYLDQAVIEGRYRVAAESTATQRRTPPVRIAIPASLRHGDIESVGAELEVAYMHDLGAARAGLAVYAAGSPIAVYDSPPLLSLDIDLVPGIERRIERRIANDPRLLDLVRQDSLSFGFEFRLTPTGGDTVAGRYGITRLHLDLTSILGTITAASEPEPTAAALPR